MDLTTNNISTFNQRLDTVFNSGLTDGLTKKDCLDGLLAYIQWIVREDFHDDVITILKTKTALSKIIDTLDRHTNLAAKI